MKNVNIKARRAELGISQRELARRMGVKPASVAQWDSGETLPAAAKLPQLACILECSIDALFGINCGA